jgi:hypothetical protein
LSDFFERLDKHGDGILKRSVLILKLRLSPEIVQFIHHDAVSYTNQHGIKTVLTLDQVLSEIEKDENYE